MRSVDGIDRINISGTVSTSDCGCVEEAATGGVVLPFQTT